jgi:hypothetical protein
MIISAKQSCLTAGTKIKHIRPVTDGRGGSRGHTVTVDRNTLERRQPVWKQEFCVMFSSLAVSMLRKIVRVPHTDDEQHQPKGIHSVPFPDQSH